MTDGDLRQIFQYLNKTFRPACQLVQRSIFPLLSEHSCRPLTSIPRRLQMLNARLPEAAQPQKCRIETS